MLARAVFGLIGIVLMLLFLGSIIIKLREVALGVVMLIGVAMMIYDAWQSLGERD